MELKKDKPQTISGFTRRFDSKTFFLPKSVCYRKNNKKVLIWGFLSFFTLPSSEHSFLNKKKRTFCFLPKRLLPCFFLLCGKHIQNKIYQSTVQTSKPQTMADSKKRFVTGNFFLSFLKKIKVSLIVCFIFFASI